MEVIWEKGGKKRRSLRLPPRHGARLLRGKKKKVDPYRRGEKKGTKGSEE